MIASPAPVGSKLVDTVHLVAADEAILLKAAGVDGVIQYLGSVTAAGIEGILAAGLGFVPVTYADQFSGDEAANACKALGLPASVDIFLDVEAIGPKLAVEDLIAEINAWALPVDGAGYTPNQYAGVGVKLTSAQLYALAVRGYWKGAGSIRDESNALVEPACGWKMVQGAPTTSIAGVLCDVNMAWKDFQGRPLVWSIASPREAPTSPGRRSSSSSLRAVKG